MEFLTYRRAIKALIVLCFGFFWIYSFLYILADGVHNSPDEALNYYFSNYFAQTSELAVPSELHTVANNLNHPRSTLILGDNLVPVSFIGNLVVHGLIAKILSMDTTILFVPLLSAITPLFFYSIIRRLFDDKIAFLSSLFLLIHPAFMYYSARGLLPNALFLDFLILSIYFLLVFWHTNGGWRSYVSIGLSAFFAVLVVMIRVSEFAWLFVLGAALFFMVANNLKIRYVVFFFLIFAATLFPFLQIQKNTYGHYLSNGYIQLAPIQQSETLTRDSAWEERLNELAILGKNNREIQGDEHGQIIVSGPLKFVFPFGIDFGRTMANVYAYGIRLFWWLSIPALIGVLAVLFGRGIKPDKYMRGYTIVFIFIAAYLAIYYGSWQFFDNINGRATIGNSYVRYWMPIFVFALPFVSIGLMVLLDKLRNKLIRLGVTVFLLFSFVSLSFMHAFYNGEESLWRIILTFESYRYQKEQIMNLTEPNAVIITPRMDKVFFPDRNVIVMSAIDIAYNLDTIGSLLRNNVPVYIYSQISENDLNFLNSRFLDEANFRIISKGTIYDNHSLYTIIGR